MKRIALLGMPNTGKSTFFNRLTGASARVGNWPGITVELMTAKVILGATYTQVVDLPGIYSFHGFSEDEKVVRDFLENNPVELIVVILNATQIDRQLPLALQVVKLGLPAVVALNMADEARQLGIVINTRKLGEALGAPAALVSAKYGAGFIEAKQAIREALDAAHNPEGVELARVFSEDHEIEASPGNCRIIGPPGWTRLYCIRGSASRCSSCSCSCCSSSSSRWVNRCRMASPGC